MLATTLHHKFNRATMALRRLAQAAERILERR